MRASADTVLKIAADPKHLGAQVGITSVLHIWGSASCRKHALGVTPHRPHVHMIVPGGGLAPDGSGWVPCRPNFFLSVRVLSRLFRRLLLEGLAKRHRRGRLRFFGDHARLADPTAFAAWATPLRKIDWVVVVPEARLRHDPKKPFAGPKAVLSYLSR